MSQDPGAAADSAQQPDPYAAPIPQPGAGGSAPAPMYGQPNPYGEAPVSGQAQPGQQPAYGQEPYGAAQPYGPAASYGPAPVYGQQAVYGQQPVYGQQAVYGQQPVYAPPGQVPTYGPYGYPTAQPYGPPGGWDTPKTDSMSIAALVVALSGFLFGLTFPVGLGLGIAGMVRTKRRQLEGRGLAIAAVVVGALGTLLLIGFIVLIAVLGSTGGSTTRRRPRRRRGRCTAAPRPAPRCRSTDWCRA